MRNYLLSEWLFHIAIDNLDTAYKIAKKEYKHNAYNFFSFGFSTDTKFIHFDFDKCSKDNSNDPY